MTGQVKTPLTAYSTLHMKQHLTSNLAAEKQPLVVPVNPEGHRLMKPTEPHHLQTAEMQLGFAARSLWFGLFNGFLLQLLWFQLADDLRPKNGLFKCINQPSSNQQDVSVQHNRGV